MTTKLALDQIEAIAKDHLNIGTLQVRCSDSLDFHDVGVIQIEAFARAMYKLGYSHGGSDVAHQLSIK